MVNYERPLVVINDELTEGVYAASGAAGGGGSSSDCWTVSAKSVQDWNGSHNVFEVHAVHSNSVEHISSQTVVTITFSAPLTDAYSEFDGTTFSGSTVTVTRVLHANAYQSGDDVTYKVWAKAADEATTKSLSVVDITISCTHQTNVQGKYD